MDKYGYMYYQNHLQVFDMKDRVFLNHGPRVQEKAIMESKKNCIQQRSFKFSVNKEARSCERIMKLFSTNNFQSCSKHDAKGQKELMVGPK